MIKVKRHHSYLFSTVNYDKLFSKKIVHVINFLCWFFLIIIGTFLIGISTNLYAKQFEYCQSDQTFCSRQFVLDQNRDINIYVVLDNFYQNNRMFLDFYSQIQFQGKIHNNYHCENYDTYAKLGLQSNAGGYRVDVNKNAHPCGKAMLNIFNDAVFLITSDGGAPVLNSQSLISQYNRENKFINLQDYQLKQWIDMQEQNFVNYFTVGYTSTKYMLVGKASLTPDSYQLVIKNNYRSPGAKRLLVSSVNQLGIRDPVIGFFMFISGILGLFFHLILCCKG